MSVLTPAERAYLATRVHARIATSTRSGLPDVATVSFTLDVEELLVSAKRLVHTALFRNLMNNPRATLIIDGDDNSGTEPLTAVKIHGYAGIEQRPEGALIRIAPEAAVSWSLDGGDVTRAQ